MNYRWSSSCPAVTFDEAAAASPRLSIDVSDQQQLQSCDLTLTLSNGEAETTCHAALAVAPCPRTCSNNATPDICGVCGGDGRSCLDCSGAPFGLKTTDRCGECGGDGRSCLRCATPAALSAAAAELKKGGQLRLLKKENRELEKLAAFHSNRARILRLAAKREQQARRTQESIEALLQGAESWKRCDPVPFCKSRDLKPIWSKTSRKIRAIGTLIEKSSKARAAIGGSVASALAANRRLRARLLKKLTAAPKFTSDCE